MAKISLDTLQTYRKIEGANILLSLPGRWNYVSIRKCHCNLKPHTFSQKQKLLFKYMKINPLFQAIVILSQIFIASNVTSLYLCASNSNPSKNLSPL